MFPLKFIVTLAGLINHSIIYLYCNFIIILERFENKTKEDTISSKKLLENFYEKPKKRKMNDIHPKLKCEVSFLISVYNF